MLSATVVIGTLMVHYKTSNLKYLYGLLLKILLFINLLHNLNKFRLMFLFLFIRKLGLTFQLGSLYYNIIFHPIMSDLINFYTINFA